MNLKLRLYFQKWILYKNTHLNYRRQSPKYCFLMQHHRDTSTFTSSNPIKSILHNLYIYTKMLLTTKK